MKIAICDDDKNAREVLKTCCGRFAAEFQIDCQVAEYASGEELLRDSSSDVLLLDVEMPGMNGIAVKNFLQNQRAMTRILFVSSHEEAITEAFGREVYGFLYKPVTYELFREKMQFLLEDLKEQDSFVTVETKKIIQKIFVRDIVYIKADGKYTKIYLQDKENYIFSDVSLQKWRERLGQLGFGLCQRSYLVNFYYVDKVEKEIFLQNGKRLPLSRRMEKEFVMEYKEYVWRKAK